MKYIHCLKSWFEWKSEAPESTGLTGLNKSKCHYRIGQMFLLAKYSMVNDFSVEAGSNYLMTLKKYTYELYKFCVSEPDRLCV